jgi:hypothetical protein
MLVNEGETVRLPCLVDSLGGFVLIWKQKVRIESSSGLGYSLFRVGKRIFTICTPYSLYVNCTLCNDAKIDDFY